MSVYVEDEVFAEVVDYRYVITPVPEVLTIEWEWGDNYCFDNLSDCSSLAWIPVMMETFRELFPGVDWMVDDPGTLYVGDCEAEEAESSPYDMEKMQKATDLSLSRYASLLERLVAHGFTVASE